MSGTLFNEGQNVQGPVPMIKGEVVEKVDLVAELVGEKDLLKLKAGERTSFELAHAYKMFDRRSTNPGDLKKYRNGIQGRLLQASDQACGVYINFLRQFETEGEFWLGTAATALGGAGAIFTRANTARALAGLAGVTSGVRAEFRQAFFSNLATHVIVPGIQHRRKLMLEGGLNNYQGGMRAKMKLSIEEYPVQHAVQDAFAYHAHCNLMTGLVESAELIKLAKNPGIEGMNIALAQMGETRSLVDVLAGKAGSTPDKANDEVSELLALSKSVEEAATVTLDAAKKSEAQALENLTGETPEWTAAKATLDKVYSDAGTKLKEVLDKAGLEARNVAGRLAKIKTDLAAGNSDAVKARDQAVDERAVLRIAMRDVRNAGEVNSKSIKDAVKAYEEAIRKKLTQLETDAQSALKIVVAEEALAVAAAAAAEKAASSAEGIKTLAGKTAMHRQAEAEHEKVRMAFDKAFIAMGAVQILTSLVSNEEVNKLNIVATEKFTAIEAAQNLSNEAVERAMAAVNARSAELKASIVKSMEYVEALDPTKEKQGMLLTELMKLVSGEDVSDAKAAKTRLVEILNQGITEEKIISLAVAIEKAGPPNS